MTRSLNRVTATRNGGKMEKEFHTKYPHLPLYSPYVVAFTNFLEFKVYNAKDHEKSAVSLGPHLHENLMKHLLKYEEDLLRIGKHVYKEHLYERAKTSIAEFDAPTPFKKRVIQTIENYKAYKKGASSANQKLPRKDLLSRFSTELQVILAPYLNPKLKKDFDKLNDPWNPVHLSLSFPLFCRIINTQVHTDKKVDNVILEKQNRYFGLYRKEYIIHMSLAAVNNMEFTLAILSAFGTDARKYPSGVLSIMAQKRMLRRKLQNAFRNPVPLNAKTLAEIEEAILIENGYTPQPSFSSSSGTGSGGSRKPTPPFQICKIVVKQLSVKAKTISLEEFMETVEESWKLFHGAENCKLIPPSWYRKFKCLFPIPANRDRILDNFVELLLIERKLTKECSYKILRLSDTLSKDELDEIEEELAKLAPTSPVVTLTETTPIELLMLNSKSLLQQALLLPENNEGKEGSDAKKKFKSVPFPDYWAPDNCMLPYHGFRAHLDWMLKQDMFHGNERGNLNDMDPDVLKLRYVEYISLLNRTSKQLTLGMFSAYGHNILNYPIRVLQILKERGLFRESTKLYSLIQPLGDRRIYSRIITTELTAETSN